MTCPHSLLLWYRVLIFSLSLFFSSPLSGILLSLLVGYTFSIQFFWISLSHFTCKKVIFALLSFLFFYVFTHSRSQNFLGCNHTHSTTLFLYLSEFFRATSYISNPVHLSVWSNHRIHLILIKFEKLFKCWWIWLKTLIRSFRSIGWKLPSLYISCHIIPVCYLFLYHVLMDFYLHCDISPYLAFYGIGFNFFQYFFRFHYPSLILSRESYYFFYFVINYQFSCYYLTSHTKSHSSRYRRFCSFVFLLTHFPQNFGGYNHTHSTASHLKLLHPHLYRIWIDYTQQPETNIQSISTKLKSIKT